MQKRNFSTLSFYLLSIGAILSWWYFAFIFQSWKNETAPISDMRLKQEVLHNGSSFPRFEKGGAFQTPTELSLLLKPLNRSRIHEALSGNFKLMLSLMSEWDAEARILKSQKLKNTSTLSEEKFLRAQIIGRQLLFYNKPDLIKLRELFTKKGLSDDAGKQFNTDAAPQRLLPQTFVSASILLALIEPENIVALPQGIREQKELYPIAVTEKIPLNINRYNSEKIFQKKPDIAFVAHYSLPSVTQALTNQKIPLFTINSINSFTEITGTVSRIGHLIHRPQEAELLALFMESAMLAIDNHLLAATPSFAPQTKILFVNSLPGYSIPTENTITGDLLKRLHRFSFSFVSFPEKKNDHWAIPIDQELIAAADPDCLIVSSSGKESTKNSLFKSPAILSTSAAKNSKIYCIDSAPQAPTQYVVLAYYDIVRALMKAANQSSR